MAYLPGFEHDIFISYARLNEGADKWVSRFHERLEATLKQHTSKDLKIWRDTRWLDGGQLFDQTIEAAIDGSGLLLALNSHAHRGSDYCQQEVQWFCDKTRRILRSGCGLRRRMMMWRGSGIIEKASATSCTRSLTRTSSAG